MGYRLKVAFLVFITIVVDSIAILTRTLARPDLNLVDYTATKII